MTNESSVEIPFRVAVMVLKTRLMTSHLLKTGNAGKIKAFLDAPIEQIEAQPEWVKMVLDATMEANMQKLARRVWMTRMHVREYERANRPRTLDVQVGPLVNGSPSLSIKQPGIKNVGWKRTVSEKIESFLMKQPPAEKYGLPILTYEVRSPRPDHDQGLTY